MVAVAQSNSSNGHAYGLVPTQGGAIAIPTILGRKARSISVDGCIRAGIKALTKKAAALPRAREIYEAGVAAGKGFETIEKEIAAALPDLENPLTPRNVPYFTVRGEDFPNPEIARQIMDLYAEDRGDGVKRLYRFPVIFPTDAWQSVMPHELVTWTASERKFWSEYSEDGQTRYCKTYERPAMAPGGQRVVRVFGGRKATLRAQNGGICDPEQCAEYQAKKCNLSGRFIFFVPGVRSLSAFEVKTNSFYAMQAAIEKFQTLGFMRGGRISGYLDGRGSTFFMTKRLVEVSRISDDGSAVRTPQWLIEIEAPVDPTALLRHDDTLDAVDIRASEAAEVLQGDGGVTRSAAVVVDKDGVIDMPVSNAATGPTREQRASTSERAAAAEAGPASPAAARQGVKQTAHQERAGSAAEQAPRQKDAPAAGRTAEGMRREPVAEARTVQGADGSEEKEVRWLLDAAAALGVDNETYEAYAAKRWGQGWKKAAGGRKRALEEVNQFQDNASGFVEKVRSEIEVWS